MKHRLHLLSSVTVVTLLALATIRQAGSKTDSGESESTKLPSAAPATAAAEPPVAGDAPVNEPQAVDQSLGQAITALQGLGWNRQEIGRALAAKLEVQFQPVPHPYWTAEDVLSQNRAAEDRRVARAEIDRQLHELGLPTSSEEAVSYLNDPEQRAIAAELLRQLAEANGTEPDDSQSTTLLSEWAQEKHPDQWARLTAESRRMIELNTSETALQLRALPGMNWSPESFSQVHEIESRFAAMDRDGSALPDDPEGHRKSDLIQVLGQDGFAQYVRAHDPAFESLALWAKRQQVPEDSIAWLYDVSVSSASVQPDGQSLGWPGGMAPPERELPSGPGNQQIKELIRSHLGDELSADYFQGPGSWLLPHSSQDTADAH